MSDTKEPKPAKPIIDVAHPGKTAPPLTSKPVIVTNRAILKDPMMVDESNKEPVDTPATEEPKTESKPKLDVKAGKVPISHMAKEDEATDEAKPTSDAPAADQSPSPQPPASDEAAKHEDKASSDDDVSDVPDDGAQINEAQIDAEAAAQAKRDEQVQKLIDSKKYYVPVNAVEKRRTKRVIALGVVLAIILALAWVDIALDAGLIQIDNVKPVTHFFSN